jgi:hypothetical protein
MERNPVARRKINDMRLYLVSITSTDDAAKPLGQEIITNSMVQDVLRQVDTQSINFSLFYGNI